MSLWGRSHPKYHTKWARLCVPATYSCHYVWATFLLFIYLLMDSLAGYISWQLWWCSYMHGCKSISVVWPPQRLLSICPRVVYLGYMVVAYLAFCWCFEGSHADFHSYCTNLYSHQEAYLWAHHLGLFFLGGPFIKKYTYNEDRSIARNLLLTVHLSQWWYRNSTGLPNTLGEVGILAKQKPISDRYHNEQSRCLVSWSSLKMTKR